MVDKDTILISSVGYKIIHTIPAKDMSFIILTGSIAAMQAVNKNKIQQGTLVLEKRSHEKQASKHDRARWDNYSYGYNKLEIDLQNIKKRKSAKNAFLK